MSYAQEYIGVLLSCCKKQQVVATTMEEEASIQLSGKITKPIECELCGAIRTLHISRQDDRTQILDITFTS